MSTDAKDRVHRLTDMKVEEVSLVDRPANKRAFLIVKREGEDMASGELRPDGKGGLTAKGATKEDGKKPSVAKSATAVKKLDFPPGFKEMVGPMLEKLSDKLSGLSDMVGSGAVAEIPDEGGVPPIPGEFFAELGAIMEALSSIESMYPGASVAAPEGEEPMPEGEEGEAPAELEMRLGKAINTVAVAKVGAKMSKERYDRFTQALSVLGSLLQELKPGLDDVQMRVAAKTKKNDAAPAHAVDPRIDQVIGAVGRLTEQVGKLAGAVAKQESRMAKADQTLETIQKSRGVGNAIPVEGSSKPTNPDVSWPLDMNAPVERSKVGKADYFGED